MTSLLWRHLSSFPFWVPLYIPFWPVVDHVVLFFGNESALQSFRTFTFELIMDINWGSKSRSEIWVTYKVDGQKNCNWTVLERSWHEWPSDMAVHSDSNDRLKSIASKRPSRFAQGRPIKPVHFWTIIQFTPDSRFLILFISNLFKTKAGFQNDTFGHPICRVSTLSLIDWQYRW